MQECVLSCFSGVQHFVTPWTVACQVLLSMGILQARILEWVPMPSSRGSSHIPYISSVAQLYPTLCDSMDCSMQCFLVHHQLPELAQTHVYRVDDAIQPSHHLSSPSPPAFSLSQHQSLFLEFKPRTIVPHLFL